MAVWSGLKAVSCGKKVRTLGAENSVISDHTLRWFLNINSIGDNCALITSVESQERDYKRKVHICTAVFTARIQDFGDETSESSGAAILKVNQIL